MDRDSSRDSVAGAMDDAAEAELPGREPSSESSGWESGFTNSPSNYHGTAGLRPTATFTSGIEPPSESSGWETGITNSPNDAHQVSSSTMFPSSPPIKVEQGKKRRRSDEPNLENPRKASRSDHGGPRKFSCLFSECGYSEDSLEGISFHMQTMHKDKADAKTIPCTVSSCYKSYRTVLGARQHKVQHWGGPERPVGPGSDLAKEYDDSQLSSMIGLELLQDHTNFEAGIRLNVSGYLYRPLDTQIPTYPVEKLISNSVASYAKRRIQPTPYHEITTPDDRMKWISVFDGDRRFLGVLGYLPPDEQTEIVLRRLNPFGPNTGYESNASDSTFRDFNGPLQGTEVRQPMMNNPPGQIQGYGMDKPDRGQSIHTRPDLRTSQQPSRTNTMAPAKPPIPYTRAMPHDGFPMPYAGSMSEPMSYSGAPAAPYAEPMSDTMSRFMSRPMSYSGPPNVPYGGPMPSAGPPMSRPMSRPMSYNSGPPGVPHAGPMSYSGPPGVPYDRPIPPAGPPMPHFHRGNQTSAAAAPNLNPRGFPPNNLPPSNRPTQAISNMTRTVSPNNLPPSNRPIQTINDMTRAAMRAHQMEGDDSFQVPGYDRRPPSDDTGES